MESRPYQQAAINAVLAAYDSGTRRQLIVMATGSGKTHVFGCLYEKVKCHGQMLILSQTDELVRQTAHRMMELNPNARITIEMGSEYVADPTADIISASVQTLGRKDTKRVDKFNWSTIKTIVIDEAHHSTTEAYRRILDKSGSLLPDSSNLLLGCTATPSRTDGISLVDIFEKVTFQYPIRTAINEGYLVDIRGYRVHTDTSLAGISSSKGDFSVGELSERIDTPLRNQQIVDAWKRLGEGRKTVVYCVDIQHAKDMANAFRDSGVAAEAVWGDDPERSDKLSRHKDGQILIVCVCQLILEGYDDPTISTVVLAKPSQSATFLPQAVGRGTRLAPSKKDLIVIDVVDGTVTHSLVTLPTLMGLPNKLDIKGQLLTKAADFIEQMQVSNPAVDFTKLEDIDEAKILVEKVDMFSIKFPKETEEASELTWFRAACGGYKLLVPKKYEKASGFVHVYENALGKWELDGSIAGDAFHGIRESFEESIRVADEQIRHRANPLTLSLVKREAVWKQKPVSEGQRRMITRLFPHKTFAFDQMSSGQASHLISERLIRKAGK